MLAEFMQETFETPVLRLTPTAVNEIKCLNDLPSISFSLADGDGKTAKAYYNLEEIPNAQAHGHHMEVLARRVHVWMQRHQVHFGDDHYRWHSDPVSYLTACIRATLTHQGKYEGSVIREDRWMIRLPKGALLHIVAPDHRYFDREPSNREFLLSSLFFGHCFLFGAPKMWILYHPHVRGVEIETFPPDDILDELEGELYSAFGFVKGHFKFEGQAMTIMRPEEARALGL